MRFSQTFFLFLLALSTTKLVCLTARANEYAVRNQTTATNSWDDDLTPITRVISPGGTATGSASATISTNTSMSINNSQFVSSFIQAY